MDALAAALRAEPPEAVRSLPAEQQAQLAAALDAAVTRQAAELDRAADRGLAFVPRLLRGPVKKLLF